MIAYRVQVPGEIVIGQGCSYLSCPMCFVREKLYRRKVEVFHYALFE
jgi:hypothetical protein